MRSKNTVKSFENSKNICNNLNISEQKFGSFDVMILLGINNHTIIIIIIVKIKQKSLWSTYKPNLAILSRWESDMCQTELEIEISKNSSLSQALVLNVRLVAI